MWCWFLPYIITRHLKWDQGVQTHYLRGQHPRPKSQLLRVPRVPVGGDSEDGVEQAWGGSGGALGRLTHVSQCRLYAG